MASASRSTRVILPRSTASWSSFIGPSSATVPLARYGTKMRASSSSSASAANEISIPLNDAHAAESVTAGEPKPKAWQPEGGSSSSSLEASKAVRGSTPLKRKEKVEARADAPRNKVGRPRKVQVEAGTEAPQKKQGRPRKVKVEAGAEAPKSKEGRPRKVQVEAGTEAPKSKRGRPRKVKVEAGAEAPKSKEGRPRKVQVEVAKRKGRKPAVRKATMLESGTEAPKRWRNAGKMVEFPADSSTPFPHLPDPVNWNSGFARSDKFKNSNRFFVGSESTVENVVNALELERRGREAGQKMTILEGYPGAGTVTRRFMSDDGVEKVVAMEDHDAFLPWLKTLLTDTSLGEKASRLECVGQSCYDWSTYTNIIGGSLLDNVPAIEKLRGKNVQHGADMFDTPEWKYPSPLLYFVHLPTTVHGEQLLSQFVSAIAHRLWMYQFLRMPMVLVCSEQLANRCIAPPGHPLRGKMTLLAEALTDTRILLDSSHFLPHEEHFWPSYPEIGPRLPRTRSTLNTGKLSSGITKSDNCLLLVEPKVKPMVSGVDMDAFEFVLRNLFVLKSHPVGEALKHMAPGAANILNMMQSGHPAMQTIGPVKVDPGMRVTDLSVEQLVGLAKVFERWPFRPLNLFQEGRIRNLDRLASMTPAM